MRSPHAFQKKRITRSDIARLNAEGEIPVYPYDRPLDDGESYQPYTVEGVGSIKVIVRTKTRDGISYIEPSDRIMDAIVCAAVEGVALTVIYDRSYRQELVAKVETTTTRAETEGTKLNRSCRGRASHIRCRTEAYMADLHRRTAAPSSGWKTNHRAAREIRNGLGRREQVREPLPSYNLEDFPDVGQGVYCARCDDAFVGRHDCYEDEEVPF